MIPGASVAQFPPNSLSSPIQSADSPDMDKPEPTDTAIVVLPRSTVLEVWRVLAEAVVELAPMGEEWGLPTGAGAALEGQATVLRLALDALTRHLDGETAARAAHPAGRAAVMGSPETPA